MNGDDWDIIAEEQGVAIQERRLFSLNSTKNRRHLLSPTSDDLNVSKKLASGNDANSRCTPKFPVGLKLQFGSGPHPSSMEMFYSSRGYEEETLLLGEDSLPVIGKDRGSVNRNARGLRSITQETKDESMATIQPVTVPELRPFDFGS